MERIIMVDQMRKEDWNQVKQIYQDGIETGNATFDTEPPDREEWDRKYLQVCRLVAREGNQVIGWAALLPVASKDAFSGVAELSIYLRTGSSGKGVGTKLMDELVKKSESKGFWTLQAGIFLENHGSIRLHEKFGFKMVGVRSRIGKLNGVWRDVLLMERRSTVVGLD
ncbi:GNAT family N-acetyltransferase [Virgibacillus xinjiangensis]|uniref:GNAT family N-acetyltransferase n=1 Tax=Virgibacillus xinjiangensis TaxID=393090 RepID=A0ABV7CZN2_9BACI